MSQAGNKLLTVIIPHRNIPELLKRCLDSIPARDDLQVIVVDDCSDNDVFSYVSDCLMGRDVELYKTQTVSGGGAARNEGLKHAKGEWITFIDADDLFTMKFNVIVDSLSGLDADIDVLYCAANSVDSDYFTTSNRANLLNKFIRMATSGNPEGEMRLRYTFGEPWCKIVRRRLIECHDIRFTESSIHNDTKYSYLVGYHAKRISSTPYALCTITTRSGSVSRTLSESKKLERITIFGETHKFYRESGIPQRYVINFLWPQMAKSFLGNRDTYKKGYEILKQKGFTSAQIKFNTMKHIFRNNLVDLKNKVIKMIET